MTVIVVGVPGVGKTTVITRAAELAGVPVAVYGTAMLEEARKQGLVEERDEMRKLDPSVQKKIQEAAAENIATRGHVIVDTHGFIATPKGYLPGLPDWVARKLKPKMVVLIEADAEEISSRRQGDDTRVRDSDTPEAIQQHQDLNRMAAASVAVLTGATVASVRNNEGEAEKASTELARLLE